LKENLDLRIDENGHSFSQKRNRTLMTLSSPLPCPIPALLSQTEDLVIQVFVDPVSQDLISRFAVMMENNRISTSPLLFI
jgi:hypothetical protein